MHEMSLAENIVQLINDAARDQQFTRVKTIWLEIGQLACVEKESLRFCFDVVAQDSIAQQARLEIIDIAGQAICMECQQAVPIASYYEACPDCGNTVLQTTQGTGMRIKEIEVE